MYYIAVFYQEDRYEEDECLLDIAEDYNLELVQDQRDKTPLRTNTGKKPFRVWRSEDQNLDKAQEFVGRATSDSLTLAVAMWYVR